METLVTRVDDALPEPSSREGWRDDLENALARAINECSAENLANRPDFVLGMFLSDCLFAFSRAIHAYTPPAPTGPAIYCAAALRKRELLEQVNDMATGAPPIVSQIDQRDMSPARALKRFLDQAGAMAASLRQAESRLNRRMDRLMTPRERADLLASKRFSLAAWSGCVETAAGNLERLVSLTREIEGFFQNREEENNDDSE